MSLWYANSSPRYIDSGKFRQRARTGLTRTGHTQHQGWSYHFTSHETGTSIKRTSYSVSIMDPNNHQAEYLRGYSSIEQASQAAQDWIDQTIKKMEYLQNPLGSIPKFPNAAVNQEK